MHISYSSTSVLLPLFYALFAQTAFLPTTRSLSNETLLGLPIINISGALPAIDVAPIPVSSRNIVLAFTAKGRPIPENEVKDTLVSADQAIADLARNHPTQRITNDRFEYRRPNGGMLISITTYLGEEITWMELNRVLQGLYQYMTAGMGTEETHYQALEFEMEASGQVKPNIGFGLVWYFDPPKSEFLKRVSSPFPISYINGKALRLPSLTFLEPSNVTLRRLPNASLALPGANTVQENKVFPIPKTSLSLNFYFFGPSIPDQSVKATLQGAMSKIRPFLNGPSEIDPIENDSFRWVLPRSRGADIPVAVTVFTYHKHKITWRQLFDVLFGLYAFTTTFGTDLEETHYQVLGFRIVGLDSRKLGVGTISYFRSETGQLAKRMESFDRGTLQQRPSALNISSFTPMATSNSIVYPVANTNMTLTFTFLGDTPIPQVEINVALGVAQMKISHAVMRTPDNIIPGKFNDISTSGRLSTNIHAYPGKVITWRELDYILRGVLQFCQDDQDHDRVLVFEIDIEAASRRRIGFGTLLYVQSDPISVEKRALATNDTTLHIPTNSVISRPSLTTLAVSIPYPIPGTPIKLDFNIFGPPIPSIYVNAAFTSALRSIQNHVTHHPNTPIPNDRWERRGAVSRIWVSIVAYTGNKISWQELSLVLAAVLRFMTEAGDQHCCEVTFLIDKAGGVQTGYGSVAYSPDDDIFVETEQ